MSIASLGNVNLDGKTGESPGGYQGESSDQAYLGGVTCGEGAHCDAGDVMER